MSNDLISREEAINRLIKCNLLGRKSCEQVAEMLKNLPTAYYVDKVVIGGADELYNMLPACRSCNHYKHTLDVEEFRQYLGGISHRLMRDSIPFQIAIRYGLVRHMGDDVTFYFETMAGK